MSLRILSRPGCGYPKIIYPIIFGYTPKCKNVHKKSTLLQYQVYL